MYIYDWIPKTKAEGPGVRFCVYVQGCSQKCNGCFSKHLWDIKKGKNIPMETIIDAFRNVEKSIDGLTLLGGEPFDQAEELWKLAAHAKNSGKNVIAFTGYKYEDLIKKNWYTKKLLKYTDLLCDGPYIKELTDYTKPMLGSSNQRYIWLSNAITKKDMMGYRNSFEFRIKNNGQTQINGMGNISKLKEYLSKKEEYDGRTII